MGRPPKIRPGNFELDKYAHKKLVDNLVNRTTQWTSKTMEAGTSWYPGGKEDSEYIGSQNQGNVRTGAALLAKVSPQTDWQINRMKGLQFQTVDDKASAKIQEAASLTGKENAEARKKLRGEAGLQGTPLNYTPTTDLATALKMRDKPKEEPFVKQNFPTIGTNQSTKIQDFGESLASGGKAPVIPIDVHAYDAAVNTLQDSQDVSHQHLGKAHVYNFVHSAYVKAHATSIKQGLIPSNMTLGDYQATHWVHQQTLKKAANPRSAGAVAGNQKAVRTYLSNRPDLDPQKHGLQPIPGLGNSRQSHFDMGAGGN